jgi:UvrD-like helicase C-terminal domain
MTQRYPTLQRNLLYTGVTRGKKLVVLVGQKKALAIAVPPGNVNGPLDHPPLAVSSITETQQNRLPRRLWSQRAASRASAIPSASTR